MKQVALLYESHLDKFKLLSSPDAEKDPDAMTQNLEFCEENFVEDSDKHEAAVQFCVKFSSGTFGEFPQLLVLDFGGQYYLRHSLEATVVSSDAFSSPEPPPSVVCQILEWSIDELNLVPCPKLLEHLDFSGKYNVPYDLPESKGMEEFTPTNYCKLWHTILFIEEMGINREISR